MPQQRLYYDYVDDHLIPYWYVLTFDHREIDWKQTVYYYDVIKPFEFVERDDFDESKLSIVIRLSDLVFNQNRPNGIGINLKSVGRKIESHGVDPCFVKQFIISTPELDEFLMYLPNDRKMEFAII